MWAKIHLNRFLRWILATLLSIIFPYATIKNPDGSERKQRQEKYRNMPLLSVSSDDMPESDHEENEADSHLGEASNEVFDLIGQRMTLL
ncbi:unnamed protein product [Pseudo-nitzschia multistriata]|uniref:Uncharacterized protein n=1 Tax=Pseudo-nitzschia multistriata TaxID=183589 RepID=A0A448Z709_9STRA|nr:unnamed protein product [Pseudo-nitzschia multistriata]